MTALTVWDALTGALRYALARASAARYERRRLDYLATDPWHRYAAITRGGTS